MAKKVNEKKVNELAKHFIELLSVYRRQLSRQQLRTLKGQALAGDIDGAIKGLHKLVNKAS